MNAIAQLTLVETEARLTHVSDLIQKLQETYVKRNKLSTNKLTKEEFRDMFSYIKLYEKSLEYGFENTDDHTNLNKVYQLQREWLVMERIDVNQQINLKIALTKCVTFK